MCCSVRSRVGLGWETGIVMRALVTGATLLAIIATFITVALLISSLSGDALSDGRGMALLVFLAWAGIASAAAFILGLIGWLLARGGAASPRFGKAGMLVGALGLSAIAILFAIDA